MDHLKEVASRLNQKINEGEHLKYFVPNLWVDDNFSQKSRLIEVNPYRFYAHQIETILKSATSPQALKGGDWSRRAIIYNLFVRHTTAFDHDQNGKLDLPVNGSGFRETGTFLKSIALLPYIKRLGANTIHLLPVTSIGKDGSKGNLGSPYAIQNPFKIDDLLHEPALGVGVEEEFKAFVEAAHLLGMRVVVEFVFRTASKDCDWVKDHPDWFYWIKDSIPNREPGDTSELHYGSPIFSPDALREVKQRVEQKNFTNTVPPPESYRKMFTEPPRTENIAKENGRWIGKLDDGTRVKIPGAYADWPPDDTQPPWGDVTYLKMYTHSEFNYIAYNTIRMYDTALSRKENVNRALWDTVADIIPHYQKTFGIDGVMIDMGHALPLELLKQMETNAKKINPHFAFWEENFQPNWESKEHGYSAGIGYIWSDEHQPQKFKNLLYRYGMETLPLPFFATPESHNTPRATHWDGGDIYSRFAWGLNCFLPAIPFIHSGFELGEENPVNTGLNFKPEELKKYPAEKLALFSATAMDWLNPNQFCDWIKKLISLRAPYEGLIIDHDHSTFKVLNSSNEMVYLFERRDANKSVVIAANRDFRNGESVEIGLDEVAIPVHSGIQTVPGGPGQAEPVLRDLVSGRKTEFHGQMAKLLLEPGEVRILSF